MTVFQAGPAQPVYIITDADLVENGGNFKVIGSVAIAISGLNGNFGTAAYANVTDFLPVNAGILTKNSAYDLAVGDGGKIIECTGTFTITCPDGLPTGFQVAIVNVGAGTITIAADTTLQSKDGATDLANQYGMATVYHRGSNIWLLAGDIT